MADPQDIEKDAESAPAVCLNCEAVLDDDQQNDGLCAECLPLMALPDLPPDTPTVEAAPVKVGLAMPEGMGIAAATAMHFLRPTLLGAMTLEAWHRKTADSLGGLDINALSDELTIQVNSVIESNDMRRCEALLVTQAHILDAVSNEMLRRAAHSDYLSQLECYSKIGLRAQAQCRATVEALASVRSPVVVKQTNIAHGPQQVNNQIEKSESQSKLSAVSSNAPLETVGTIHGAKNTGREIPRQSEQREARTHHGGSTGRAEGDQADN